jgi:hypothetical protein
MRTAALDENIVDVIEEPCSIGTLDFTNTGASPVYLHFFNGPASGKTITDAVYVIGCGATSEFDKDFKRMSFPTGVAMAMTAAEDVASAPSSTPRVSLGRGAV